MARSHRGIRAGGAHDRTSRGGAEYHPDGPARVVHLTPLLIGGDGILLALDTRLADGHNRLTSTISGFELKVDCSILYTPKKSDFALLNTTFTATSSGCAEVLSSLTRQVDLVRCWAGAALVSVWFAATCPIRMAEVRMPTGAL